MKWRGCRDWRSDRRSRPTWTREQSDSGAIRLGSNRTREQSDPGAGTANEARWTGRPAATATPLNQPGGTPPGGTHQKRSLQSRTTAKTGRTVVSQDSAARDLRDGECDNSEAGVDGNRTHLTSCSDVTPGLKPVAVTRSAYTPQVSSGYPKVRPKTAPIHWPVFQIGASSTRRRLPRRSGTSQNGPRRAADVRRVGWGCSYALAGDLGMS